LNNIDINDNFYSTVNERSEEMGIGKIVTGMPWNKKIEILRITRGWSQDEAAAKCNTGTKVYWLWENGKSYPRNNSRRSIAMAFEVPETDIFSIEENDIRDRRFKKTKL
jgi:transcriptional regulator with XRE-family HTH domain